MPELSEGMPGLSEAILELSEAILELSGAKPDRWLDCLSDRQMVILSFSPLKNFAKFSQCFSVDQLVLTQRFSSLAMSA